ncbi:MAG: hypothetical protein R3D62_01190 [Xanthobacteraceae bacterium]
MLLCSAIITASVIVALLSWAPSGFVIVSNAGTGDAFEAYHGALNIERFGWRWAGLQDVATNPAAESHPYFYIHHVNLGIYISYALQSFGIVSIEAQSLVSIVASVLGFAAALLLVLRVTKSWMITAVFVCLLTLDIYYLTMWYFNVHRAFTYISVFGTAYAFFRLSDSGGRSFGWAAALFACCLMLIGADYMFFFFTFIALACCALLFWPESGWRAAIVRLFALGAAFGSVFVLRQLQVIAGIGYEMWSKDFHYQVLNRVQREDLFQGDWSKVTSDFYENTFILNPGFAPAAGWPERLHAFLVGTGEAYLRDIIGFAAPSPSASFWVAAAVFAALAALVCLQAYARSRPSARTSRWSFIISAAALACSMAAIAIVSILSAARVHWLLAAIVAAGTLALAIHISLNLRPPSEMLSTESGKAGDIAWVGLLRLSLSFLIGCLMMYALFPRYFLQWYPAFLLAALCTITWAVALWGPALIRLGPLHAATGIIGLKLLAILPIALGPAVDHGDHAKVLRDLRGQIVVSNFTPASVASYTHAFSGWIKADAVPALLSTGKVRLDDYFMLFERDRNNPRYTRPDYFLFFRGMGSAEQIDDLIGRGFKPMAEGNSYLLFKPNAASR